MSNFKNSLRVGKIGESQIAKWFMCRGFNVLPVYEKEQGDFKGPVLFMAGGEQSIAPDMMVFKKNKVLWIEAKHKSAFAWHRNTQQWTTGIDLKHYFDYLAISQQIEIPIWLLFLHRNGVAKDTPPGMTSPTGLYGNSIDYLKNNESHRHANFGKHGGVFWTVNKLRLLAPLEHFEERSAIGEYDFGLTPLQADVTASVNFCGEVR
jgi:hypothetical protein